MKIEPSAIARHFCSVISCERCTEFTSSKLQRDSFENVPQPGWVGNNYSRHRLLLVGQNPGVAPDYLQAQDSQYTEALRNLTRTNSKKSFEQLYSVLMEFVPNWPVQRNYFPLEECGLGLEDIAYCNVVRCRTVQNAQPAVGLINNCLASHFVDLVGLLEPRVVIFIGKWAHDRASHLLDPAKVAFSFMNRQRSLSSSERRANRQSVIELVKSNMGS